MKNLSGFCIYTMRHSAELDAQLAKGGRHVLTEGKAWVTGQQLWDDGPHLLGGDRGHRDRRANRDHVQLFRSQADHAGEAEVFASLESNRQADLGGLHQAVRDLPYAALPCLSRLARSHPSHDTTLPSHPDVVPVPRT